MNIYEKLTAIQNALKAPKDAENKFGNYKYRTIDSINEALKPLLEANKASATLTDELVLIGDRFYIKSTATLHDNETIILIDKDGNVQPTFGEANVDKIECVAYAREPENKKGSDESQITGAAATYARKYALTGLFLLDNSADDPDATNKGEEKPKTKTPAKKTEPAQEPKFICAKCGAEVDKEFAEAITAAIGKCYCRDCNTKRNEAIKKKRAAEEEAKKNVADGDLPFPI